MKESCILFTVKDIYLKIKKEFSFKNTHIFLLL